MAIWWMREQEKEMNIEQLKETLKIDEGVVYEIYNDHLGYPTFGIGHLVLEGDPEHGMAVGTPVAEDRVDECFAKDVEVRQIVANMMFNMGLTRLSKFRKHNAALQCGDWKEAAVEGRDSRWYKQVTNRAERLMSRLEAL